jgi:hypothetical protein
MMTDRAEFFPGSARASRAGFGAIAETIFLPFPGKVRDREVAIASTRGACAPR